MTDPTPAEPEIGSPMWARNYARTYWQHGQEPKTQSALLILAQLADAFEKLEAQTAATPAPDPTTEAPACECPPCPGRGNDGHGMTHCAECCFGSGVEADIACPVHGERPTTEAAAVQALGEWDMTLNALAAQVCLRASHGYDAETHGACWVHLEAARITLASDWLRADRAEQRAEGWDKGYVAGHSIAMRRMSDEPNAPTAANPYRDALAPVLTEAREATCPMHSDDPTHVAVRQNRVNLGYEPQPCACATPTEAGSGEAEPWCDSQRGFPENRPAYCRAGARVCLSPKCVCTDYETGDPA